MAKCRITKKGIKTCKGMAAVLQDPYARGTRQQGVSMHTMVNLETGKFSRHIIVVKSGKHGKKGIIMNNCPFCAAAIYRSERTRDGV